MKRAELTVDARSRVEELGAMPAAQLLRELRPFLFSCLDIGDSDAFAMACALRAELEHRLVIADSAADPGPDGLGGRTAAEWKAKAEELEAGIETMRQLIKEQQS